MRRLAETRFGSFQEALGVAVYRDPWWFRTVRGASLAGSLTWVDIADCAKSGPHEPNPNAALDTAWLRASPCDLDAAWFRSHAPLALALNSEPSRLAIDLIATQIEDDVSIAYPFLLQERAGSVFCGFSDAGPTMEIRDSIVCALAGRFLWAGRPS